MRVVFLLACVIVAAWLAACDQTPLVSPINRIPRPTAPTAPSATDPDPTPAPGIPPPPFLRTIVGTVREANGGPLAGVEITGIPTAAGVKPLVTSAEDGSFRIDHTNFASFFFSKQGYNYASWSIPANSSVQELQPEIRMQSRIELLLDSGVSSEITPDDATFASYPFDDLGDGDKCSPCKLIHVSGAEAGTVLRLSWSGPVPLALWAGQLYDYSPTVSAIGVPGSSHFTRSTSSRVDFALVGISHARGPILSESISFTLTITRR